MIAEEDIIITERAWGKMQAVGLSRQHVLEAIERGSKFHQAGSITSYYGYYAVSYKPQGPQLVVKSVFIKK